MVRKKKKQFHKFEVRVPEQTIQEHADIRNSIAPPHQAADDDALKIHGLGKIESSSDSDSGKSEFDEEYYKYRPGPILIDNKRLVVIDKENRSEQKSKRVTSNIWYSSVVKDGDGTTQYPVNQNEGKNTDPLEDLKKSLVFINSNFPLLNENAASTAIVAKPFTSSEHEDATKFESRNAVSGSSAISRNNSTYINSSTLLKDSELDPFEVQAPSETYSQIKYVDADFYSLVGKRSALGDTRATSKGQIRHKLPTKRGNNFHSTPAKRSQSSVHSKTCLEAASKAGNSNLFNISGHISDVHIPSPISEYPYSRLSDVSIIKCDVKPPDLSDLGLPDTYLKYPRPSQQRGIDAASRSSRSNLKRESPISEPLVVCNPYQSQLRLDSPRTTSIVTLPVLRNQPRALSTARSANTIATPRPVLEVAPSIVIAQPIVRQNSTENCEGNRDSAHGLMSEDTSCRSYKYLKYICCVC